ncbi:MAG: ribonuclease HII [Granulosicoccus sp.]
MPATNPVEPFPVCLIAGVDEVGRGPLAGPVVAAAVILDPLKRIDGLLDSKLLDEATRDTLDVQIRRHALAFCIAEASVAEIDAINILHASMLAMQRAVEGLDVKPNLALIDGNRCPDLAMPMAAVVKGDQRVQAISAASIIAKVARDRMMVELHRQYPQYGLAQHKGYPTPFHRKAILEHGIADFHRCSFKPVREALATIGRLNSRPEKLSKKFSNESSLS